MAENTDVLAYALKLVIDGTLSIDECGRIWRHRANSAGGPRRDLPRRAESAGGKGYLRLMLSMNGILRGVGAHRVVWAFFNQKTSIPVGMQINHIDSNKQNNGPNNLELVTQSGNIRHSYANARPRPWRAAHEWRAGRPRLTAQQITEARKLRADGVLLKNIAERFGIGVSHAHRITS